jgi:hypothetical protein
LEAPVKEPGRKILLLHPVIKFGAINLMEATSRSFPSCHNPGTWQQIMKHVHRSNHQFELIPIPQTLKVTR